MDEDVKTVVEEKVKRSDARNSAHGIDPASQPERANTHLFALLNSLFLLNKTVTGSTLNRLFSCMNVEPRTWKLLLKFQLPETAINSLVVRADEQIKQLILRLRERAIEGQLSLPMVKLHTTHTFTDEANFAYRVLSRCVEVSTQTFQFLRPQFAEVDTFLDQRSTLQLPALDLKKYLKQFQEVLAAKAGPVINAFSKKRASSSALPAGLESLKIGPGAIRDKEKNEEYEYEFDHFDGMGVRENKHLQRAREKVAAVFSVTKRQKPTRGASQSTMDLQVPAVQRAKSSLSVSSSISSPSSLVTVEPEFVTMYLQHHKEAFQVAEKVVDCYVMSLLCTISSLGMAELLTKIDVFTTALTLGQNIASHLIRNGLPLLERVLRLEPTFISHNVFPLSFKGIATGEQYKEARAVLRKLIALEQMFNALDIFVFPKTLYCHAGSVKCIAMSRVVPNCVLTGGYDRMLRIWDLKTGDCLSQFVGHTSIVTWCAFGTNDAWVASASFDATVRIWNARDGRVLHTMRGHTDSVISCDVSKDEKFLVSGSMDSTVRMWATDSGTCLRIYHAHSNWVKCVRFSPNMRKIVSAGLDNSIIVWDLKQKFAKGVNANVRLHSLHMHEDFVLDIVMVKDQTFVTAAKDQTIRVWDHRAVKHEHTLETPDVTAVALCVSPNQEYLGAAFFDNTIVIYSTKNWEVTRRICVHNDGILTLDFKDSTTLIAGCSNGAVQLINL